MSGFALLQAVDVEFGYGLHGRPKRRGGDAGLVVRNVSLTIPRATVVALIGPNGSGKTTLLKLLSGGLRPTAGTVELEGKPLTSLSQRRLARRLAVVPQETYTPFDYTVFEMVSMGRYAWLGAFQAETPADRAAVHAALEATGASALVDRLFSTLSGGEKQRVIIAAALAQLDERRPSSEAGSSPSSSPLLFLDEPTTALDLRYQIEIMSLLEHLHTSRHMTLVLSTHDLRMATHLCRTAVLLREGQVVAWGPSTEMLTPARLSDLYGVEERHVAPLLT